MLLSYDDKLSDETRQSDLFLVEDTYFSTYHASLEDFKACIASKT